MLLVKEKDPLTALTSKICDHVLSNMESGKPDPAHVQILLAPAKVQGFDPLVDENYPLVAWVNTGCLDPAKNDKIPSSVPARACSRLFVADEYIAGKVEDGQVQLHAEAMLPWYEQAIREYALPDGWSVKDWVFTNQRGESVPYVKGMALYPDGTWTGVSDPEAVLSHFARAYKRVSHYVNEVVKAANPTKGQAITDYDSAMAAMRSMTVPDNLERTARDAVYGYGNSASEGAKETRQALTAFLQAKIGVPIRVFEPVYSWPS